MEDRTGLPVSEQRTCALSHMSAPLRNRSQAVLDLHIYMTVSSISIACSAEQPSGLYISSNQVCTDIFKMKVCGTEQIDQKEGSVVLQRLTLRLRHQSWEIKTGGQLHLSAYESGRNVEITIVKDMLKQCAMPTKAVLLGAHELDISSMLTRL